MERGYLRMNGWRVRVWARAAANDVDHEAVYEFDDPRAAISAAVAAALAQLATTPVEVQVRTLQAVRSDGPAKTPRARRC